MTDQQLNTHEKKTAPLNAVVAFESAARHKSFKKSGDEQCVTSSAISHQVRLLEDWLGLKLLERSTRSIELTDAGIHYSKEISPLLDRLETVSCYEIKPQKNTITIQTTDSFASRWLIHRLSEFESLNPGMGVKIVTYDFREKFRSSEADLGILFVNDKKQRENQRLLLAEEIFPVCSPGIIKNIKSIQITDLANLSLIHNFNVGISWQEWISAAFDKQTEMIDIDTKEGYRYSRSHLALQSAEIGNGIALVSNVLG